MNKWIAGIALVYIVGLILGATFENQNVATFYGTTKVTTLEYLTNLENITYKQSVIGDLQMLLPCLKSFVL